MEKKVLFMGGLGNQLWICAYAYKISNDFTKIKLDNSWYEIDSDLFFNSRRVKRKSYLKILEGISENFEIYHSPLSLLSFQIKNKFNLLKKFISKNKKDIEEYYHQNEKNISSDFINKLVDILFDYYFKSKNRSLEFYKKGFSDYHGLHIRLGDRGEFSEKEIKQLKEILDNLDNDIILRIFSDNYKEAEKLIRSISDLKIMNYAYQSELEDFIEMAFAKKLISLRESTFSFWAKTISPRCRFKLLNMSQN